MATLIRSRRAVRERFASLRLLLVTLDNHAVARAKPMVLLDEGIAQRAFLLFVEADGVRTGAVDRYVATAPLPDVLVHVEASAAVVQDRLAARAHRGVPPRLSHLDDTALERRLREGSDLLARVIAGFEARGCRIIRTSGDDPEEVARQLFGQIS